MAFGGDVDWAGGVVASRSATKGCESPCCWLDVKDCQRCDASACAALASEVILGVLDTAELPKDSMNPMSACNRQASVNSSIGKPMNSMN